MKNSFILACKQNYLEGITPSNKESHLKDGYTNIVNIAKGYFEKNDYESFSSYFQEGQYLIPLWTAHLLLEYGSAKDELNKFAISIIVEYCDNPLAPKVAKEEQEWMKVNGEKYR